MRTIEIFDSTLRDGAQGEGISFSVQDRLNIVRVLDSLGVAYIEAGNPGSNPKELEFFREASSLALHHAELVAFGPTRRKNISAQEDKNVQALLNAGTKTVAVFGKCWDLHAVKILRTTLEENLNMIRDTCRFLSEQGKRVIFDAEHFFDGWQHNAAYAMQALSAAAEGGASCLTLCDTNGGAFPDEVEAVVAAVCEAFPGLTVGIHCHNDGGMAAASSVLAVKAGAGQVQGTFLGFGERCGNTSLATVIPTLQLKRGCRCIPPESLSGLTAAAREIAEISNTSVKKNEPYIGSSAFAHKAGMHADGVLKDSRSFEHIDPELVGNERRFLISEISGRGAVLKKIHKIFPQLRKDSPELTLILSELKRLEGSGYQFEGAEASLELLCRRLLGGYAPFFELISYKTLGELPHEGKSSTATLKVRVGDKVKVSAAEGDGPINALDRALRESLCEFYPVLESVHLIDYKVRVMDPSDATAATVRVLITSTDGAHVWSTVGLSSDIIEASWRALVDSIEYRLIKGAGV